MNNDFFSTRTLLSSSEGATGPRCDMCIATYLRIPKFGCRHCDECVFALKDETEIVGGRLGHLQYTIGNVSKLALAGARLNRFSKQLAELEPRVNSAISIHSGSEELSDLAAKISAVKDSASAISIRAERALEQLSQLDSQLDNILRKKLGEIKVNAKELVETRQTVVQRIADMQQRFEKAIPLQTNKEQMIADAGRKLDAIRAFDERYRFSVNYDTITLRLFSVMLQGNFPTCSPLQKKQWTKSKS
jgi:ABC-type transporter Mla subunit MlaD